MISVEDARNTILSAFEKLPAEVVPLPSSLGRTLAEDLASRMTQPPAAVSAMDGYALKAADLENLPARLRVVCEIAAGEAFAGELSHGQAARIFTGAPLPAGTDSIVIQEVTSRDGDFVSIQEIVPEGHYVRPAGLDFHEGEVVLTAGRRLGVREIGLAAAMNIPWLKVTREPRIAILTTGNELVMPGEARGPHQILSSNGLALQAFIETCGGKAINLGIAPDDPEALQTLVDAAAGADLIVTTGGASVGDHDLVRSVLGENRMDLDFWKVAMRPGKPLIFGKVDGTSLLGLPGNPVSALVCSLIFLRPAIARLLGCDENTTQLRHAVLHGSLPENDKRQDYLRGTLQVNDEGVREVTPYERQDSSMLRTLCESDCLIVRPPHATAIETGALVDIIILDQGL